MADSANSMAGSGCPFSRLQQNNSILASTGCTRQVCQAGRVLHTDEPRIGENRSVEVVEREAEGFLRELQREGFYGSDDAFEARLRTVQAEIRNGAVEGTIREDRRQGLVAGNWEQSPRELEFGLRRAWRNARKCIMRSHSDELQLCDLRYITSSAEMATELLKGICKAYNNGSIQPTTFLFPPRTPNSKGPMVWNHQVLEFAAYEAEDGTIVGDPVNVQLTKDIMELGWEPPKRRGRWDLLPLVVMADGDSPVVAELPVEIRSLVDIRHPQYSSQFESLDLKWVAFPALTRLGFDIGGVQYTAAPFVGWFMDAEIGVRDLADTFRYNALPDIVEALGLTDGKFINGVDCFEDLPEFERLSMLSRAQQELNYAVHWSYLQARVKMTDTLTASEKWCRYDDEFNKKNGYRLPSDPYWLAPPQGSIIPLWHRGGAPNYQPKPMISRHVEDPVKAWGREKQRLIAAGKELKPIVILREVDDELVEMDTSSSTSTLRGDIEPEEIMMVKDDALILPTLMPEALDEKLMSLKHALTSMAVLYCSAGTIANKLAVKVHHRVNTLVKDSPNVGLCPRVEPLDALEASDITSDKIFLLVISSTGQGEIPANGAGFEDLCKEILSKPQAEMRRGFKFAVFGNGDSNYLSTFNGAAIKVAKLLTQIGGISLTTEVFPGDTSVESLPLSALNSWWNMLQPTLQNLTGDCPDKVMAINPLPTITPSKAPGQRTKASGTDKYRIHGQELRSHFRDATLIDTTPEADRRHDGSLRVTLDIGEASYDDMSCIQVLPVNSPFKVRRALRALCMKASTRVRLSSSRILESPDNPTVSRFLSDYADLELPFTEFNWLRKIKSAATAGLTEEYLKKLSVLDVLEILNDRGILTHSRTPALWRRGRAFDIPQELCLHMPLLHARTYSVASSLHYLSQRSLGVDSEEGGLGGMSTGGGNQVDILVKVLPYGRFSDVFLHDNARPAALKYRFVDSITGDKLRHNPPSPPLPSLTPSPLDFAPLVVLATGAGFGPVRCLLQQRIALARDAVAAGHPIPPRESGISLFLGLRPADVSATTALLNEAMAFNLVDTLCVVPSNEKKVRVYDKLVAGEAVVKGLRRKLLGSEDGVVTKEGGKGMVFVCTCLAAARATQSVFEGILGGKVRKVMGDRYLEEVY